MPRKQKKYHFIYKTTNKITERFYVGLHSTDTLEDSYLGSGKIIKNSINKYGRENHRREIICFCNNRQKLLIEERKIVNHSFLKNPLVMNLSVGGTDGRRKRILVKEKNSSASFYVKIDDPRYLSGELESTSVVKGTIPVRDKDGNRFRVSKDDPRWISGELVHNTKNTILVKNDEGICFRVSKDDSRWLSGELISPAKGTILVINKQGEKFRVIIDDPRIKSGELNHIRKGINHSKESMHKMIKTRKELKSGHGNKNGMAKKWFIISPFGNVYKIDGNIQKFCDSKNICRYLLIKYKGVIVPPRKRKISKKNREKILSTIGWILL